MTNAKGICTEQSHPLEKTKSLQKLWCNPVPEDVDITLEKLHNSYSQIEEELSELADIIADIYLHNYSADSRKAANEVSDICVDLLEYIQQLVVQTGLTERVKKDSYKIYLNNCTKICENEEEAMKTLEMYLKEGVECRAEKHPDGHFVIKRTSDNKTMKPFNFKPVEL